MDGEGEEFLNKEPSTSRRLESRSEREGQRPGGSPRPQRQRPTRGSGGGRRRSFNWTSLLFIGGALGVVAILVYAVIQTGVSGPTESDSQRAQLDADPALPGVYFAPHPGPDGVFPSSDDRRHLANGTVIPICTEAQLAAGEISDPLCYTSNPPTSGRHADSPAQFKVLDNPAPRENLVHSMEHGAVVVWYNTDDPELIDELASIVNEALDRRRLTVMSFYPDMEPDTVAFTAWTRLDKMPASEFTRERLQDFIEEHQRRFNPEGY